MYVTLGAKIGGLPETLAKKASCTSQEQGHDQFIFWALDQRPISLDSWPAPHPLDRSGVYAVIVIHAAKLSLPLSHENLLTVPKAFRSSPAIAYRPVVFLRTVADGECRDGHP